MKKNLIYFLIKFNETIYAVFSQFNSYVAKAAIGFSYAFFVQLILSFFGKNFFKTILIFFILLFIFQKLNFLSLNINEIRETIGFSANENYLELFKSFFNLYYFEILAFSFFLFFLRFFF